MRRSAYRWERSARRKVAYARFGLAGQQLPEHREVVGGAGRPARRDLLQQQVKDVEVARRAGDRAEPTKLGGQPLLDGRVQHSATSA